jgi:hypothetical protein
VTNLLPYVNILHTVDENMIKSLASEGPAYLELADDFEFNGTEKGQQIAQFFKVNKKRLPNFYKVFKIIALILPSNATSERLIIYI